MNTENCLAKANPEAPQRPLYLPRFFEWCKDLKNKKKKKTKKKKKKILLSKAISSVTKT